MTLRLYLDVHVPRAITVGLRMRGYDVLTAQQDGYDFCSDRELLQRATALGRVLFSQDSDLLREAAWRRRENIPFAGIIYAHQQSAAVGKLIEDIALAAEAIRAEELENRVLFLPL